MYFRVFSRQRKKVCITPLRRNPRAIWWQHLEEPCCPACPKSGSKRLEYHDTSASECYQQPLGVDSWCFLKASGGCPVNFCERNPKCYVGMPAYAGMTTYQAQPPSAAATTSLKNLARCPRCSTTKLVKHFSNEFGAQSVTKPRKIRQVLQEFHTKSQLPGSLKLPPRNRTASSFSLDINFSYAASSSKPGPPKGSNKAFPVLVKISFLTGAASGEKKYIGLHGFGSWLENWSS